MKEKIKNSLKAKFLGENTSAVSREKAIAILIIGFSVIFALIIFIRINVNNNIKKYYEEKYKETSGETNKKQEIEFLSLDKLFSNYIDNYKYDIAIDNAGEIIKYNGAINDNIDDGKKIKNNEEINYHIVNGIAINLQTNEEISNIYEEYLSFFFVPTNVYEFIRNLDGKEEIVDNIKKYSYNSIYNDVEIMFNIVTSKDRIEEINYSYNNVNYTVKLI